MTGKVIRFDDVRGYGFNSPDIGGEDIFLHANDLEMEKPLARPGARVSYEIEEGARGKFATAVRLASDGSPANTAGSHVADAASVDDDYYEVLSVEQFLSFSHRNAFATYSSSNGRTNRPSARQP